MVVRILVLSDTGLEATEYGHVAADDPNAADGELRFRRLLSANALPPSARDDRLPLREDPSRPKGNTADKVVAPLDTALLWTRGRQTALLLPFSSIQSTDEPSIMGLPLMEGRDPENPDIDRLITEGVIPAVISEGSAPADRLIAELVLVVATADAATMPAFVGRLDTAAATTTEQLAAELPARLRELGRPSLRRAQRAQQQARLSALLEGSAAGRMYVQLWRMLRDLAESGADKLATTTVVTVTDDDGSGTAAAVQISTPGAGRQLSSATLQQLALGGLFRELLPLNSLLMLPLPALELSGNVAGASGIDLLGRTLQKYPALGGLGPTLAHYDPEQLADERFVLLLELDGGADLYATDRTQPAEQRRKTGVESAALSNLQTTLEALLANVPLDTPLMGGSADLEAFRQQLTTATLSPEALLANVLGAFLETTAAKPRRRPRPICAR